MCPVSVRMLLPLLLLLAVPDTATADEPGPTDFDLARFLEVPQLVSPAVSPDGAHVAWRWTSNR